MPFNAITFVKRKTDFKWTNTYSDTQLSGGKNHHSVSYPFFKSARYFKTNMNELDGKMGVH